MARVVLPGVPLHVTQRGIRRFDVFSDESDRQIYLNLLWGSSARFHLRIYCLMTNHVHLVAIPEREDSLWRTLHRCHGVYATRFNMKYGFTGHLWQARPFSCALDEEHFWTAIRYVERNPVRAGMVDCAEHYPWSSAATHCGLIADSMPDFESISSVQFEDWSRWLATGNPVECEERIRQSTFTGRPCGNESFVREAERSLGRHLAPQKPGRKPKVAVAADMLWITDEIRR